jgi:hypothetical protein
VAMLAEALAALSLDTRAGRPKGSGKR